MADYGIRVENTNRYVQVSSIRPDFSGTNVHLTGSYTTLPSDYYDPITKGDIMFLKWNRDWHFVFGGFQSRVFISLEREHLTSPGQPASMRCTFKASRSYQSRTIWDSTTVTGRVVIIRPTHNNLGTPDNYGLRIENPYAPADFTFDTAFFSRNISVQPITYFDIGSKDGIMGAPNTIQGNSNKVINGLTDWILVNCMDFNRIFFPTYCEVGIGFCFVHNDAYLSDGVYYQAYSKVDLTPSDPNSDLYRFTPISNRGHLMTARIEGYT